MISSMNPTKWWVNIGMNLSIKNSKMWLGEPYPFGGQECGAHKGATQLVCSVSLKAKLHLGLLYLGNTAKKI